MTPLSLDFILLDVTAITFLTLLDVTAITFVSNYIAYQKLGSPDISLTNKSGFVFLHLRNKSPFVTVIYVCNRFEIAVLINSQKDKDSVKMRRHQRFFPYCFNMDQTTHDHIRILAEVHGIGISAFSRQLVNEAYHDHEKRLEHDQQSKIWKSRF